MRWFLSFLLGVFVGCLGLSIFLVWALFRDIDRMEAELDSNLKGQEGLPPPKFAAHIVIANRTKMQYRFVSLTPVEQPRNVEQQRHPTHPVEANIDSGKRVSGLIAAAETHQFHFSDVQVPDSTPLIVEIWNPVTQETFRIIGQHKEYGILRIALFCGDVPLDALSSYENVNICGY